MKLKFDSGIGVLLKIKFGKRSGRTDREILIRLNFDKDNNKAGLEKILSRLEFRLE